MEERLIRETERLPKFTYYRVMLSSLTKMLIVRNYEK